MPNPNHIRALKNLSVPYISAFWREAFLPEIVSVQVTPVCISATFAKAQRITECILEVRRTSILSFVP